MKNITAPWITKSIKQFTAFLASLFFTLSSLYANPVLDHVSAGNIAIQQTPQTTTVNQTSQRAIINWQSFNIGSSEHTHFQQPNGGVALNRISGQQGASQIYGTLTATGQIILVNPAGIYFGPSAYVNVGGLIATTADISDQHFMNGHYQFTNSGPGSIINEGTIIAAQNGLVALIGSNITNTGMIEANLGIIILATGNAFTINFSGNDLISFSVDEKSSTGGQISQRGLLSANGGKIMITADAAANVLDNAINMSGIVEAKSVALKNGEIIFSAHDSKVTISGKVIATGKNNSEKGGTVKILGKQVDLQDNALIDVSGNSGGGTVLLGGNKYGAGPEPNAHYTALGQNVVINARALITGEGGNVVVWSDYLTNFNGTILAMGGELSGNGGFVEVSSHRILSFKGIVNLMAAHGNTGTLLLDPENLTIQLSGTTNTYSYLDTYTANLDNSIITVADLENALAIANVTLQTGNIGPQAGDITIADNISWNNANSLTLNAHRHIIINAGVTINNSGGGDLILRADSVGSGVGTVTNNGTLNINGAGQVSIFYNPSSYTNPTTYSNTGSSILQAYMLVNTPTNLQNISTNLGGTYALGRNITMSGTFTPIGNSTTPFTGILNGNFHTISNLTVNTAANVAGLFGQTANALIENLALHNISVTNTGASSILGIGDATGGLIGYATGTTTVRNIFIDGNVSYNSAINVNTNIGGLIGYLDTNAIVDQVGSRVNVSSQTSGLINVTSTVGGIAGVNAGTMTNAYATGSITVGGGGVISSGFIGGLAGNNAGSISSSYSAVPSISTGGLVSVPVVGGFVGVNLGTLTNNYWDNTILTGLSSCGLGGCGGAAARSTALMQTQSTFTGFNFSDIWGMSPNYYPYLQNFAPRIISGTVSMTGGTVNLYANGVFIDSQIIPAGTGTFSFSYLYNTILDNDILLLELNGFTNVVNNAVALAPHAGGSLTDINMTTNGQINLGSNTDFSLISNSLLATALGSLNSPNLLYSYSGNNITLGNATHQNVSLLTTTPTSFLVDGTISHITNGSASLTFNGAVGLNNDIISNGNQTYLLPVTLGSSITLSGNTLALQRIQLENNTLVLNTSSLLSEIADIISGTGGLELNGTGMLSLFADNTYSGITNINSGALRLNHIGALGNSSAINVLTGSTLDINVAGPLTNTIVLNLEGNGVSNTGALRLTANHITLTNALNLIDDALISGTGTGLMTLSGIISGANDLTIQLANAGISLPTITLTSGSNLAVNTNGPISQTAILTISGTSSFHAGSNSINLPNNNLFTGNIDVSNSGNNDVTLVNTLPTTMTSSIIGRHLTITSTGLLTLIGNTLSSNNGFISLTGAGVTLNSNATVATGSNPIILQAGNNTIALNNGSQLLSTGNIDLTANNFSFAAGSTPSQIGGTATNTGFAANVLLHPFTAGTTIGMAGGAGILQLNTADLTTIRATNVQIGSPNTGNITIGTWTPTVNFANNGILTLITSGTISQSGNLDLSLNNAGLLLRNATNVTLTGNNILNTLAASLPTGLLSIISSHTNSFIIENLTDAIGSVNGINATLGVTLRSLNSGIVLNAPISANAVGIDIVLTGTNFINNVGATALLPGAGHFQVWSTTPLNDIRNGLPFDYIQYNATYGSTTPLGIGNGFLYSLAPILTVSLTGTISKVYDATNVASLITPGNYAVSGVVMDDNVTITQPSNGTYDNVNVGFAKNVSVSGLSITSATNGSATVYGYQLAASNINANIGEITPATLTVSNITANNKTYDATTHATLNVSSAVLNGILGSDDVMLDSSSYTANFVSPNIGNLIAVSVNDLGLSGTSSSNYILTQPTDLTANITAIANNPPIQEITSPPLVGSITTEGVRTPLVNLSLLNALDISSQLLNQMAATIKIDNKNQIAKSIIKKPMIARYTIIEHFNQLTSSTLDLTIYWLLIMLAMLYTIDKMKSKKPLQTSSPAITFETTLTSFNRHFISLLWPFVIQINQKPFLYMINKEIEQRYYHLNYVHFNNCLNTPLDLIPKQTLMAHFHKKHFHFSLASSDDTYFYSTFFIPAPGHFSSAYSSMEFWHTQPIKQSENVSID